MNDLAATIAAELRHSAKYRDLCDQTIERIAADAARRHARPAEAVKSAKRKLHQVFAAYSSQPSLRHLLADVAALPDRSADPQGFANGAESLLNQHASTAERSTARRTLYQMLWDICGVPATVLDLACGYHPFSLPWMHLPTTAVYHAFDIDKRLIAGIDSFLKKSNQPGSAGCGDLLVAVPQITADVALLFKALPVLQQQEKGSSLRVLRSLRARHAIVSFPLRTLGGRDVGMAETYDRQINAIAQALSPAPGVRKVLLCDEAYYVLLMR